MLCSLVLKAIIPEKTRNRITPYVFALFILLPTLGTGLTGMTAVIFIAVGYVVRAFLLDGFQIRWLKGNPTVGVFLMFWLYMVLSMIFGDFPSYASMYYVSTFIDSIMVGYFVGMWILRNPDSWGRFLRITSVTAAICLLFYARHGIFSAGQLGSVSNEMRSTISFQAEGNELRTANENYVGLLIASLLPYPFLLVMGRHFGDSRAKWIKMVAYAAFILLVLALIRTGSRNACLGLIPILVYLFFAKTTLTRSKKIAFRVFVFIVILGAIAFSFGALDRLRIYTASVDRDDISSGRMSHFEAKLYGRTDVQKWFGCGALYDYRFYEELGRAFPPMSNGHSMYFQILWQSGYIGVFFLFIVILATWLRARKLGARGHVVLLLFFVWALCGVAESLPLLYEGMFKPLVGIALAFCTKKNMPGMYQLSGGMPYPFMPPPSFSYGPYPMYRG